MANKYGEAALIAARMETYGKMITPTERWAEAIIKLYPKVLTARRKSAPRAAFLGLCEAGSVVGIIGSPATAPNKSKVYATEAANLLFAGDHSTVTQLWNAIAHGEEHASQMDVVLALWKNNLLVHPAKPQT